MAVASFSAVLLALFVGVTSSGWARERDAAYQTLAKMETRHEFLIVSREPGLGPAAPRRRPALAPMPLDRLILLITALIAGGFLMGGAARVWELTV